MAGEVLRQLCPAEAQLLSDPTLRPVLRFRFGGTEYPPTVLFKVFLTSGSSSVVYMSGKKMILPASEAAIDACERMGRRKFMDQLVEDTVQQVRGGMTDERDISNIKEYRQHASKVDNQPAYLGGRSNGWRTLYTEVAAAQGLLYDIVNYLQGGEVSEDLRKHLPDEDEYDPIQSADDARLQKLRALEAARQLRGSPGTSKLVGTKRKQKLAQMRKLYGLSPDGGSAPGGIESDDSSGGGGGGGGGGGNLGAASLDQLAALPTPGTSPKFGLDSSRDASGGISYDDGSGGLDDDSDLDEGMLYQWSQSLPADDA